ncbi:MAG: exodeoxyribonuclease VII small subunit [Clostridiales Family XIII bacterium]|nr:exodeoxyribonuclease VII small subunit [Clostridiales Family XIII bacterium]
MSAKNKAADGAPSFEEALAGLEKSVEALKNDGTTLQEAMKNYEDGIRDYRLCETILRDARQKIEILDKDGTKG